MTEATQSALKPITNVEYLSQCYDMVEIDPLNLAGTSKTQNVFDMACTTEDKAANVMRPPGVYYLSDPGGDVKGTSRSLYTSYDYQKSVSRSVEVSAGFWNSP